MDTQIVLLLLASLIGLYMAANIGANDLANAMGTSVGSGALTLRRAVIISIVANLFGAVLAGGHVTNTISKGIINPDYFSKTPDELMLGMFAALLAAGLWVHLATIFGLPVSTTHSIVGAVVGFGVLSVGIKSISWSKVLSIALSWIISPLAGAVIAAAVFYFIRERILRSKQPEDAAMRYSPFIIGFVLVVIVLSFIFKGLKNLNLDLGLSQALSVAVSSAQPGYGTCLTRRSLLSCRFSRPVMWHLPTVPTM